jgi:hypothetical protein
MADNQNQSSDAPVPPLVTALKLIRNQTINLFRDRVAHLTIRYSTSPAAVAATADRRIST